MFFREVYQTLYHSVMKVHILFGIVALVSFWMALSFKKGSDRHRKVGLVFFFSLVGLCLTSFVVAGLNIYDSRIVFPFRNWLTVRQFNVFYFYMSAYAFTGAWNGRRVIQKKSAIFAIGAVDYWMNVAVGGMAVGIGIYGYLVHNYLFVVVGGILGPWSVWSYAWGYFRLLREIGEKNDNYIMFHIMNMIGAGLGVHTAFFAGGAMEHWFPWLGHKTGSLLWYIPGFFGTLATVYTVRKYRLQKKS